MTVNVGQLAASSLRNRSDTFSNNVEEHNAFLAWLRKGGRIETRTGGRTYLEPVIYSESGTSTAKFYDGAMESFGERTLH